MTQNDNIKQNEELKEELEKDLWLDSNDNDNEFIENDDNIDSELDQNQNDEISKLKELLARTQADYNNFKMRSERDRQDMIFFLKYDIFKKILPRVDDLERIIKNTKDEEKQTSIYEAVLAMHKNYSKDLESMWVLSFESIWMEVDPDKHEVMTQIPSETPWVIIDEFEKGYTLWDRVLRVAKVIVWA